MNRLSPSPRSGATPPTAMPGPRNPLSISALGAAILLAVALLVPLFPRAALADHLVLAADTWCPFNCDPRDELPGFMVEIARAAFEAEGHSVEYVVMPWKRAVEEARNGRVDGVIGALKGDAPDLVFPENETGMARIGFYTLKSSDWTYAGPDSAKGRVFGSARGYSYGPEIDDMIARRIMHVDEVGGVSPLVCNLCKLQAGRIDVLVAEGNAMAGEARRLKMFDEIRFAGSPNAGSPVYIAFSPAGPRSREYARTLSEGVEKLRKTGRLAKILKAYGLEDWE